MRGAHFVDCLSHHSTHHSCLSCTCRPDEQRLPENSQHGDITLHTPPGDSSAHPWSVTNPRFLATPTGSQPPTLTMHASAAAAPVGPGSASASAASPAQMAISPASPEANTAIPAALPAPERSGTAVKRPCVSTRCLVQVPRVALLGLFLHVSAVMLTEPVTVTITIKTSYQISDRTTL